MGRLWSAENEAGKGGWLSPRNVSGAQTPCVHGKADIRVHDTPMPEPLGEQLKGLFDHFSDGPMPDRLINLADALEEAFQRGELHRKK